MTFAELGAGGPGHAVLAAGRYFHWGVIQISLANLLVIVVMVVVFVLALVVPFPHRRHEDAEDKTDVRH